MSDTCWALCPCPSHYDQRAADRLEIMLRDDASVCEDLVETFHIDPDEVALAAPELRRRLERWQGGISEETVWDAAEDLAREMEALGLRESGVCPWTVKPDDIIDALGAGSKS